MAVNILISVIRDSRWFRSDMSKVSVKGNTNFSLAKALSKTALNLLLYWSRQIKKSQVINTANDKIVLIFVCDADSVEVKQVAYCHLCSTIILLRLLLNWSRNCFGILTFTLVASAGAMAIVERSPGVYDLCTLYTMLINSRSIFVLMDPLNTMDFRFLFNLVFPLRNRDGDWRNRDRGVLMKNNRRHPVKKLMFYFVYKHDVW